jgi:hypothetical protein
LNVHGNGWQRAWTVTRGGAADATLGAYSQEALLESVRRNRYEWTFSRDEPDIALAVARSLEQGR